MIVLVSASSRAKECAAAIEQKSHQQAQVAASLSKALELLQTHEYEIVVLDECFQQVEAGAAAAITGNAGNAMMVYVNLSLHGTDRVTLEVNRAVRRLASEKLALMRSAESLLRNDLRGQVTAILLNTELALREAQLPTAAAAKIKAVYELAKQMRDNLEDPATPPVRVSGRTSTKSVATA